VREPGHWQFYSLKPNFRCIISQQYEITCFRNSVNPLRYIESWLSEHLRASAALLFEIFTYEVRFEGHMMLIYGGDAISLWYDNHNWHSLGLMAEKATFPLLKKKI